MRSLLLSLALALVFIVPTQAKAQWYPYRYPPAYSYYYPPAYPYQPPYYWYGQHYTTPFYRYYYYQQYSPYTNQYITRYRIMPRWY
jgi:hypothetical protein